MKRSARRSSSPRDGLAALAMLSALAILAAPARTAPVSRPGAKAAAPHASPRKKAKLETFRGAVQSVDAAARKLTIKDSKGEAREFAVSDKTVLTRGEARKIVALGGVAAGDKALVFFEGPEVLKIHLAVRARRPSGEDAKPGAAPRPQLQSPGTK